MTDFGHKSKWVQYEDGKWRPVPVGDDGLNKISKPKGGGLDQRYYEELKRTNFKPERKPDEYGQMLEDTAEGRTLLGFTKEELKPTRHPSSQKFHDLCDAMKDMHDKKQADYGRTNDPFANVRASEDFGVAGWAGCMMRANDKMRRIQKAAQGGTLSNEGVEDSLMDLAVYSIIALVLYREQNPSTKGENP